MLKLLESLRPAGIAVVDMHGQIGPSIRPLDYARLLTKLREDNAVKGVVLNIDSPGGTATGSDLITRAVERLREEKPVVAFIGGLGASGGYMIASAAERVVALPSAIVGSIGVISYRPMVYDALSRIGVSMRVGKSGRLKDMLSPFREPTEEEQQKEQHLLDSMYELFIQSVARSRGMSEERVRELATGEVFLTKEALSNGLVDVAGDIDDAIDWVVERSGAPRRLRVVRPKRTLRELLMGRGAGSTTLASLLLLAELDAASGAHSPYSYIYTGPTGGR